MGYNVSGWRTDVSNQVGYRVGYQFWTPGQAVGAQFAQAKPEGAVVDGTQNWSLTSYDHNICLNVATPILSCAAIASRVMPSAARRRTSALLARAGGDRPFVLPFALRLGGSLALALKIIWRSNCATQARTFNMSLPVEAYRKKSGRQWSALVATSSSASGISRRKITHTSTSIWATRARFSAPIAPPYSVSGAREADPVGCAYAGAD
jgi:hypothetical protein